MSVVDKIRKAKQEQADAIAALAARAPKASTDTTPREEILAVSQQLVSTFFAEFGLVESEVIYVRPLQLNPYFSERNCAGSPMVAILADAAARDSRVCFAWVELAGVDELFFLAVDAQRGKDLPTLQVRLMQGSRILRGLADIELPADEVPA